MAASGNGGERTPASATATTQGPALCRCTPLLAARALDTALIMSLLVIQGSALNFFLIAHYHKNSAYFWFLADFAVVLLSVGALLTSYHHVRIKTRRKIQPMSLDPMSLVKPKKMSRCGVIPLSHVAWLLHSLLVVIKVTAMYRSGLAASLQIEGNLSPQILRSILGISIVIFFIQIHSYHDAESGSMRHLALVGIAITVAFEILDSIDFMKVLFGPGFELPTTLEIAILTLGSVNYILPTLIMLRLCLSDYGSGSDTPLLTFTHITIKTFVVDVPFLVIRVFIWSQCNHKDVSTFVMKNFLYIIIWVRYSLPDGMRTLDTMRREAQAKGQLQNGRMVRYQLHPSPYPSREDPQPVELNTITHLTEM